MTSPTRVLLVVHGLAPEFRGGTESYVEVLAPALVARGLEVAILCGSARAADPPAIEQSDASGIPVYRLHRRGLFLDAWDRSHDPEAEALYRDLLRTLRPDVVHVHHWIRLTRTLVAVASEEGIPSVVTLHDAWVTCPRCFRVREDGYCERPLAEVHCVPCVPSPDFLPRDRIAAAVRSHAADLRDELRLATVRVVPSLAHRELVSRHTGMSPGAFRVVPHGTMPSVPSSMCHSISARYAASSKTPSLKGVINATIEPLNIFATPYRLSSAGPYR